MKAEETYFDEISEDGLERNYEPKNIGDRLKIQVTVTGKNSRRVLEVMEALDKKAEEVTRDYNENPSLVEKCTCGLNTESDEWEENS